MEDVRKLQKETSYSIPCREAYQELCLGELDEEA